MNARRPDPRWVARDRWDWPDWSLPLASADHAYRRASGRRRYNTERRQARAVRRDRVAQRIVSTWPALMTDRGWQAATARELGVDRATVCRDVDAVLAEIGISFRLLRALMWTPAEKRLFSRLGLTPNPNS